MFLCNRKFIDVSSWNPVIIWKAKQMVKFMHLAPAGIYFYAFE